MYSHSGENILFRIRPTLSQCSSCNRNYLPLKGNVVIWLAWISRSFEVGERKTIELEWKAFFKLWSCDHSCRSEGPRLDSADAGLTQSHNESCAYPDRCQWSLEHCNGQNRGLTSPHHFENEQFRFPPHNPQLDRNKKKRFYSASLLRIETEIVKLWSKLTLNNNFVLYVEGKVKSVEIRKRWYGHDL